MTRRTTIIGNWKMHKTIEQSLAFVKSLVIESDAMVGLAVPFTALHATSTLAQTLGTKVKIGAQNMNESEQGAFTGEISAQMLKDAGAAFVILGHSERRHIYHESNHLINQKVKRALGENLQPVVCVGETLEERDRKEAVLKEQLLGSLEGLSNAQMKNIILAYEPVWAIGTGVVAKPDDAELAHRYLRMLLAEQWGESIAENMVIQYGGSVKPDNAAALLTKLDIDGLLIGGASLQPDSFSQIINQEWT